MGYFRSMKLRVLHIAWNLETGGIQTWLFALAKHFDRERFSVDFAVYEDLAESYAPDIRKLGCQVHVLGKDSTRHLETLFSNHRYDIVQLHVCPSVNPLSVAMRFGVPLRIFHNHNSLSKARKAYLKWSFSKGGRRSINARLSVSKRAAFSKFGWRAALPDYYRVQPAGIDLDPFRLPYDPEELRRELGIPPTSFVLGHVGRLVGFKNHSFLLDIAYEISRVEPDFRLLLVGDGPEREAIGEKARRLGIAEHLVFAGNCHEVARLLCGAIDVFGFPSTIGEGLPLALVEAQAAGIPCLVSHEVSREGTVIPALVRWISLRESPAHWARLAIGFRNSKKDRRETLSAVENSPFHVKRTVQDLEHFYLSRLQNASAKDRLDVPRAFRTLLRGGNQTVRQSPE
jgi:glycosyltransferase involved in cell wall biosynthesis